MALPSFHVYGMTVGMLFGITMGAEVIEVPDPCNTAPHYRSHQQGKNYTLPWCARHVHFARADQSPQGARVSIPGASSRRALAAARRCP